MTRNFTSRTVLSLVASILLASAAGAMTPATGEAGQIQGANVDHSISTFSSVDLKDYVADGRSKALHGGSSVNLTVFKGKSSSGSSIDIR